VHVEQPCLVCCLQRAAAWAHGGFCVTGLDFTACLVSLCVRRLVTHIARSTSPRASIEIELIARGLSLINRRRFVAKGGIIKVSPIFQESERKFKQPWSRMLRKNKRHWLRKKQLCNCKILYYDCFIYLDPKELRLRINHIKEFCYFFCQCFAYLNRAIEYWIASLASMIN